MPNVGSYEYVPSDEGRALNPYGDDDHLQAFAEYVTKAVQQKAEWLLG